MKISKTVLAIFFMYFLFSTTQSQEKAMTFNIRYNNPDDGENWWENRKDDVVELLRYYQPDFFGIQEGLFDQVSFIDNELLEYSYVGVGRDDGKQKGEFTALFYNTDKYELLKTETFWLSETPEKSSVGWDASMERICTYGIFKNKEAQTVLHIFNAHFDHRSEVARNMSAKLIQQKIRDFDVLKAPLIVMGDFNCQESDAPIQVFKMFLDDSASLSPIGIYGPPGTFNGFDSKIIPQSRIDYIFTKNIETIINYRHINDKRKNGLCISDHLPVLLEYEIN